MRRLWPDPVDPIDPDQFVADDRASSRTGGPWVATNMVVSADGATAVDGRSGPLGGPADREVFRALRSVADVVMVGAATVRAERYGPPRLSAERRKARRERGQAELPRIAVVTGSLELDLGAPLFSAPEHRPCVITCESADTERRAAIAEVADVVVAGDDVVELEVALATLGADGAGVVLVEGGPRLNGALVAGDLVDEWNLTLAPILASGPSRRAAEGPPAGAPSDLRLDRLGEGDGLLFVRWLRAIA